MFMVKSEKIKAFSCSKLYLLYYLVREKRKKYYSFSVEGSQSNYNFFKVLYRMHNSEAINLNKIKLKLDGYYEDSAIKNMAEFLKNSLKNEAKKILCDSDQRVFFKLMDKGYGVEEFIYLMENNNKFAIIGDHITYDVWDNIVFKFNVSEEQWHILNDSYELYLDKFTKDEITSERKQIGNSYLGYEKQRQFLMNIIKIMSEEYSLKDFNVSAIFRGFDYKNVNISRNINIFEHLLILERDKIIEINEIIIGRWDSLDEANIDIDEKRFNILAKNLKPIIGLKRTEDIDDMFENNEDNKITIKRENVTQNPKFMIKGNIGYLRVGKKEVKICDIRNSKRKSGLLNSLIGEFFQKKRSIESVFDSMKLPIDDQDSRLKDGYTSLNRKKVIIRTNWKEIQRILRKNKLNKKFYLHIENEMIRIDYS